MQINSITLQAYYDQVFAELCQRNVDFNIGVRERAVIARCHINGVSIREAADKVQGL